jgi:hypothetical protein
MFFELFFPPNKKNNGVTHMLFADNDNPFELYINHAKDFLQMIWGEILKLCLHIQNGLKHFFNPTQPISAPILSPVDSGSAAASDHQDDESAISNSESATAFDHLDDASANADVDENEVLSVHSELGEDEDDVSLHSTGNIVVEQEPLLIEKINPKLFFIFLGMMAKLFYMFVTANQATEQTHHYLRP